MLKQIIISMKMLLALMVLTGVIYPLAVTGISQIAFNHQANGSPVVRDGKLIGSELIGQSFDDAKYFWGRPSATSPAYNASASSGSNLGPTNKALVETVENRVKALRAADPANAPLVPVDLATASGSGLDPHLSPQAAEYQIPRVARARGLKEEAVEELVKKFTEDRPFYIFGQPRVNVLKLNLALDEKHPQ